jgi:hypothetical protein
VKDFSLCGDRIPSLGADFHVRKIRIGIPADRISPSNGYRLIVHVIQADAGVILRCLDLYYKPEQSNISDKEVKGLASTASDRAAD